jgi:uncharacterized membrane protein YphA (DoxX/SURF4 family)
MQNNVTDVKSGTQPLQEGLPLAVVEKHQYAFEPAALYCLVYFYFLCNGGGKLSIDNALKKDD